MALASDISYLLHNLRLSHLRATKDSVSTSIIDLAERPEGDGPWIRASGGRDTERWPEIYVCHSPLTSQAPLPFDNVRRHTREPTTVHNGKQPARASTQMTTSEGERPRIPDLGEPGGSSLKYTQTIMGPGKTGGAGMRVSGTRRLPRRVETLETPSEGEEATADAPSVYLPGEVRISPATASAGPPSRKPLRRLESEELDIPGAFRIPEGARRRRLQVQSGLENPTTKFSTSPSPTMTDMVSSPTSPHSESRAAFDGRTPSYQAESLIATSVSSPSRFLNRRISDSTVPNATVLRRRRSDSEPLPAIPSAPTSPGFAPPQEFEQASTEDGQSVSVSDLQSGPNESIDGEGEEDEEEYLEAVDGDEEYDDFEQDGLMIGGLGLGSMFLGGEDGSDGELGIGREEEDMLEGFRADGFGGEQLEEEVEDGLVGDELVKTTLETENDIFKGVQNTQANAPPKQVPPIARAPSFHPVKMALAAPAPKASGLSLLMDSHSTKAPSPFAGYARMLPPSGSPNAVPSLSLSLFFPHSDMPSKPIKTRIRRDATVEEVIGFGLYLYCEEGRTPPLDEGLEDGTERDIRMNTVGWGLRIVEDDGEVDEDFPALDRDAAAVKFSFLEFAITEATEAQIAGNLLKTPLPPRSVASKALFQTSLAPPQLPSSSTTSQGSFGGGSYADVSPMVKTSSAGGVMVLLKIKIKDASDTSDVKISTTISVSSGTYLADVLELICKKKRFNVKDWVLCLADLTFILPLDRTVESLMGVTHLVCVRRSWAVSRGMRGGSERGGDPNASVFKDLHAPPETRLVSAFDTTYKKYTVQRKAPIGRHERVLAIDGDYIHIMPSEARTHGFPSSMRTSSYHISAILDVKQSRKTPSSFKLVVAKDAGSLQKRYDFEGENGQVVAEIVGIIKDLMRLHVPERKQMSDRILRQPRSPHKLRRAA